VWHSIRCAAALIVTVSRTARVSTVTGGRFNVASGLFATVSGGDSNVAAVDYSVVP
jgi:hypothetical protein